MTTTNKLVTAKNVDKNSEAINQRTSRKPDEDTVQTIVLFSRSEGDAMSVLRILGPAEFSGLTVLRGVEAGVADHNRVDEADLVVIQREFPSDLEAYEKIITKAHAGHKPVVMDLDDLLLELPAEHPDRLTHDYTNSLLPMLQAIMEADVVTVATPALREYLLPYNKNIKVFPNYLNDELWSLHDPQTNAQTGEEITIGYMGGHSHKPDLLLILPVLESIIRKYQPRIKFHFWGIEAPPDLADLSQVDWCPPASYGYRDFAAYFQTQSADIMIAPLVDTLFNRCKSSIKYLEYSALGVPGVYSRLTPYENIIENGANGWLASSQQEWEDALSKLIDNPDQREEIARNAQKKIRKTWLLSRNAHKLKEIYTEALRNYPEKSPSMPPFYLTVKSLSRQIHEGVPHIKQLEKLVDQLHEQNTQLSTRLNDCEEEIVSYLLSPSWQMTRPLRKISSKLSKGIR